MCEILSPVGDKKTFYTAIKSGCDAVYFGLPKFNARLRAENISLDNLEELVTYAHLKGVKCYITLNTILTDKEILEAITLVEKCLSVGVDAFIVQDIGLIHALKSVFPDINLHGSTQMGIHNVRGAKVAKKLGLSRIVLSRECTIADIREIKDNVDIELEVFVQGAMCVGFSGNCYFSSIKHGASGNRGECKQLCRLNYTLSDNDKKIYGYPLSIRDNCMLDYLEELIALGVSSLKIEGRLRHDGYVAVATSTYKKAVNNILNNKENDYMSLKNDLYRVFARGEFIPLYNSGNDVIDVSTNNHLGQYIGEVVSCSKFKDIYKITIKSNRKISTGDGLKFMTKDILSMGVGNVENTSDKYIVYGKNYIQNGTKVYMSLDGEFERSVRDYSRRRKVDIQFEGYIGNRSKLILSSGSVSVTCYGDVCEQGKNKVISKDVIIEQISKWDNDIFVLGDCDIDIEDIYMPLSKINELRRSAIALLKEKILLSEYKYNYSKNDLPIISDENNLPYDNIIMGDESFTDWKKLSDFGAFVLSPTEYSLKVIKSFINKLKKHSPIDVIINLPIIAMSGDLKIIDMIIDNFKNECMFMGNNIYALSYIDDGAKIIGGYNLNIINSYSASKYLSLGVVSLTSSVEKIFSRIKNSYKYTGKTTLMTFAHCPHKTLNKNDCANCSYSKTLMLSGVSGSYKIRRYKISKCYFELVDDRLVSSSGSNLIVDIRN